MTLTLLAVSLNERPLSQPITAHFDSRGGTIGRADHNTMALPDPERHVSRLQAEIVASGAAFLIRNVGAANAIVVAGRAVGCGDTAKLSHGDEIRIGGYLLQVDAREQEAALDVTRGRAMISATLSPAPPQPPATPEAPAVAPVLPASWSPLAAPPAAAVPAGPVPAATPAVGSGNPFADLLGGAAPLAPAPASTPGTADPFADLFGAAPPSRPAFEPAPRPAPAVAAPAARPPAPAAGDPFADLMPPPAGVAPSSAGLAPLAAAPPARLPDDFDPFAPPPPPAASRSAAAAPAAADPFADLVPASAPSSIDALFGLGPASDDPLAHFMSGPPAAPAAGADSALSGVPTDPLLALFGDAVPPTPAAAPAQADHLSALNAAYQPPRVVPPVLPVPPAPPEPPEPPPVPDLPLTFSGLSLPAVQPATLPPAPAPMPAQAPAPKAAPAPRAAGESATEAERLWMALCEGAGIALPLPDGGPDERMREIGRILRSAVDGTLRLMAVRASTKHELRADVTVIQSRDNNPLKFSPDAKVGLEYLLRPAMRGFLEGPAAMDDAMHDLVGHSIGTVAGMRAAISGMLDRFSPQQLETKLAAKSVLDSVLPINRKAKLWDLYLQHHEAIREEAQEDFQHLFGRAFLAAYEQQIAQLRRDAKPT